MWLGISALVTALVSVTCHTMSRNVTLYTLHTLPPGSGPTNADWSLFIKAESDSWLCSAPLPVCSGLSVIKRSEDFLAKMFLQRKQAGSKSRGRFWKFNQIWSPLSLLCGGHVSSPSPSLSCLGARLDLSLAWAVNELKRLDHLADRWLYYRAVKRFEPNCDKLVSNTITKYSQWNMNKPSQCQYKNRVNYMEH